MLKIVRNTGLASLTKARRRDTGRACAVHALGSSKNTSTELSTVLTVVTERLITVLPDPGPAHRAITLDASSQAAYPIRCISSYSAVLARFRDPPWARQGS